MMDAPDAILARIKLINDGLFQISQILEEIGLGEPDKKVGNNYAYSCPFHSDGDPSFYYNIEMNRYNCFACNRKGGVYSLVKEWLKFERQTNAIGFKEVQIFLQKVNPEYEIVKMVRSKRVSENNRAQTTKMIKNNTPASSLAKRYIEDLAVYIHLVMQGVEPKAVEEFVF
jgi:hypothetical protein